MKHLMSGVETIEQGVLMLNIKRLLDRAETSIDNARWSVSNKVETEDIDRYIRISDAYVRIATAKIQQLYAVHGEPVVTDSHLGEKE